MRVAVLALDDVFDTGLAAVLDTLGYAAALSPDGAPKLEVEVVGLRRQVTTHRGMRLSPTPLGSRASDATPDVIVVPALFATEGEALVDALGRPDVADATEALREQSARGATIAAACTGTFLLAASSLLDGRPATTAWWLAPTFRRCFPAVQLDESRMVVPATKRFVTAGAALAHVDLALWLLRRKSPALAELAARYLVVEPRSSQAPFIVPDHLAHADPLVERFERWVRKNLARPFALAEAARAVGASERSLERRVKAVLGRTPVSFVQDLRVEAATHLLRTTRDDVEAIARRVGYSDGVTLRTLLRKKLGRGVRELRGARR